MEDRCYVAIRSMGFDDNAKMKERIQRLSGQSYLFHYQSKEKEEDFMVMKECKLPQRSKKRAKYIQRIKLASPAKTIFFRRPAIEV
uniref:Uncharacterized protein n=1 Tax=Nelumbo nucifera TaxID=4432 RepID=A0A822Z193_NELNU|nr:TPA_asm: hypothetical protein HUJ06_009121 [Nelumbo nucifera]